VISVYFTARRYAAMRIRRSLLSSGVRLSVCVRPSVRHVGVLYPLSRRLKLPSNFFLNLVAPHHSNFLRPSCVTQFQGTPLAGLLNTRRVGNVQFSTYKSPFVWEAVGPIYAHCCYGMLIGSHMADRSVSVPMALTLE